MEGRRVQEQFAADHILRFALLVFVAWMVTVVLPRTAASHAYGFADTILLLPPALAVLAIVAEERTRYWLQVLGIPLSFILASALRAPLKTPSSLPWTLMAAGALLAYWLWTLAHVGKPRPLALQTHPLPRAAPAQPQVHFSRRLALPGIGSMAALVVFMLPPLVSSPDRRSFVLTMAAAFVVIAAIGGVVPMLRIEKRKADLKEVVRRATIMLLYGLACLAILWGYLQYRQV